MNDGITLCKNADGKLGIYDNTYDVVIHCESAEEQEKVENILKNKSMNWIPITERMPKEEEYILISFENCTLPDIGRYENDGKSDKFYPGDDEKTYASYGLIVNAWMPLPEPYKGE